MVAERLKLCVRDTDTVCRQGGDEFVILLTEIEQTQDAAPIAEKLLAAFAEPCVLGGHELHITLSIGIAIYPDDGQDADEVMKSPGIPEKNDLVKQIPAKKGVLSIMCGEVG